MGAPTFWLDRDSPLKFTEYRARSRLRRDLRVKKIDLRFYCEDQLVHTLGYDPTSWLEALSYFGHGDGAHLHHVRSGREVQQRYLLKAQLFISTPKRVA